MCIRDMLTLFPGMVHLMENAVLNVKNKSHSVTAEVEIPEGGAEGVIIAPVAPSGWPRAMAPPLSLIHI